MRYKVSYDKKFGEYIPKFKMFLFWHEFINADRSYIYYNTLLEAEEFLNNFKQLWGKC